MLVPSVQQPAPLPVNGSSSRSRSMSMSMDDSINLQVQMVSVNQLQLLVRKPVDQVQELVISPPTTGISPQIAMDRPLQSEIKDLLLINEEPSNKEQSMQISDDPKVTQNGASAVKAEEPMDEKMQNSFSDVRWSNLMSSKTNSTHPSFQLHIIQDKATIIDTKSLSKEFYKWFEPKQSNLLQLIFNCIHCTYLAYFVTQILLDINSTDSRISDKQVFQWILLVFYFLDFINQIIFIQYKNGQTISQLDQLWINYIKNQLILDVIGLLPIVLTLSNNQVQILQLLHLLLIRKIQKFVKINEYIEIAYLLLQFHFATFTALAIISLNNKEGVNNGFYYQEFIVILYTGNNVLDYVIKLVMLSYYVYIFYQLKHIAFTDLNKLSIDTNTQLQMKSYLRFLQRQNKLNLQFFEILPKTMVEDIKEQRYSKLIEKIPIFKSSFSQQTIRKICSITQEYSYQPNTFVLNQETQNQYLYFIIEGDVQISQHKEQCRFELKQLGKGCFFNNNAFFKNQQSNIDAVSIGYSQIAQIDLEQFNECIKSNHSEKQKYRMMLEQIIHQEFYALCMVKCYACNKFHDINDCDQVHYIVKKSMLAQYLQQDDNQTRKKFIRRKKMFKNKQFFQKIEEQALQIQQQYCESDFTNERQYRDEIISIQNQHYLKELTNPYTEGQNSIATPHMMSQPSLRESMHSQQQQQQQQAQQQLQGFDIPNISPVQYVQQPPSGMSHSSYGQLLKDVSVNRQKNSEKNSSGNVFSMPQYSSNGSKNTNNNMQFKVPDEKEELVSIQYKKGKIQDSVYYHQKRIQNYEGASQHTPSKYQKYNTTAGQQQQQQKILRSDRKSNSCVSESEKGEYQFVQQQNSNGKQPSKYGITSSKFTGETAKQFMKNPLEMPNMEFYQSFEKSNQFSDYFPQYNIDQAIESYRQYQQSRSSHKK